MKRTKMLSSLNMGRVALFLLMGATLLMGCSDDEDVQDTDTQIHVEKVKLELNRLSMVAETSQAMMATVLPENAENKALEWSSSHPEIATVDEAGLITAISPGIVTIGCKSVDGEKVDYCLVTVTPKPIPVESISLNFTKLKLKKGEKLALVATITPSYATNQNVTWSSSNTSVVTVDEKGNLDALEFGDATVTVVTEDGGLEAKCDITVDAKGELRIETVDLPAGTFKMGFDGCMMAQPDERPTHQVTLTQGFRMSTYETTNTQFCFFLNDKQVGEDGMYNGHLLVTSSAGTAYDWGVHYNGTEWVPAEGYDNHPVIFVTWYGATEFANYLGGTLPTEAQWEYACRGGLESTVFGLLEGDLFTGSMANFNAMYEWKDGGMSYNAQATPSTGTKAVNTYNPNAYGLYNMHGNVREWVQDWYSGTYYSEGDMTDPTGPESGTYRIFRGGCWNDMFMFCRSAFRKADNPALPPLAPEKGNEKTGFRIVLPLK